MTWIQTYSKDFSYGYWELSTKFQSTLLVIKEYNIIMTWIQTYSKDFSYGYWELSTKFQSTLLVNKEYFLCDDKHVRGKVFKNGPGKTCGRQPLKNLKRHGLPVCLSRPYMFKFLKGCLQQFYLVLSWILVPYKNNHNKLQQFLGFNKWSSI